MSKIDSFEIHEYTFEIVDLNRDRVYTPGARTMLTNFAVVIQTDDGARGECCLMHGGKKPHLAQVLALAPYLIGRNPFQRELIYDDFKRALRQVGFRFSAWELLTSAFGISPANAWVRQFRRCSAVFERNFRPTRALYMLTAMEACRARRIS